MPTSAVAQWRGRDALAAEVANVEAASGKIVQVVPAGDHWVIIWEAKPRPVRQAAKPKVETR